MKQQNEMITRLCPDCKGRCGSRDLAYQKGKLVPTQFNPCKTCKGKGILPKRHYLVIARLKELKKENK